MTDRLRNIKISSRILLFYLIMSVFPVLAIGVYNFRSSARILEEKVAGFGLQSAYYALRSLNLRIGEIDQYMIDVAYGSRIQGALDRFYDLDQGFRRPDLVLNDALKEELYAREPEILAAGIYLFLPGYEGDEAEALADPYNLLAAHPPAPGLIRRVRRARGRLVWDIRRMETGHSPMGAKGVGTAGFLLSRSLSRLESGKKLGLLSFFAEADVFRGVAGARSGDGYFLLCDGEGRAAYSTFGVPAGFGARVLDPRLLRPGNRYLSVMTVEGEESLVFSAGPAENGWYVLYLVPYGELIARTREAGRWTLVLIALLMALTACSAWVLSRSIAGPLARLAGAAAEVRRGNLDTTLPELGKDEISDLTGDYNLMIREIRRLIREVYEKELKEREARFQALRSKINPHFLFNTLDTIRWTARKNRSDLTGEYLERLSGLFRSVLEDEGGLWPLEKELAYVKNYLFFQEIRYSGRVRFRWTGDLEGTPFYEEIRRCLLPPLILQPLVENVLVHALSDGGAAVTGTVSLLFREGALRLAVEDDGAGCRREDFEKEGSMALTNIRERLALHYGGRAAMETRGRSGEGCSVVLTLPLEGGG